MMSMARGDRKRVKYGGISSYFGGNETQSLFLLEGAQDLEGFWLADRRVGYDRPLSSIIFTTRRSKPQVGNRRRG